MIKRDYWVLLLVGWVSACGGGTAPENPGSDDTSTATSDLKAIAQFENNNGTSTTLNVNGVIDTSSNNPFFRSMGTNGRMCATCHVPSQNWTITPAGVRNRFDESDGLDPIFRTNDGSNSPNADVSTNRARRAAYSMLLTRGVIRVGLPIPPGGELELVAADDPYHFASAAELSLFRRPLPSTNLVFLTATMIDGRESTPIPDPLHGPNNTTLDLSNQANNATLGHAQATSPLPDDVRAQIVAFELGLFTAQTVTHAAGPLSGGGATGGVLALSAQTNYFGINDVLAGDSRSGTPFNHVVMTQFTAWSSATGSNSAARQSIARGEALFNTKPIPIAGVRGVNDVLGVATLQGSCTTCHDAPNVGNHSVRLPLDLGLTDPAQRKPDQPLYTLCKRNMDSNGVPIPGTCDGNVPTIQTTDPGRALITGKWSHIATFKGPILRALSGRAPYFHNGSAATLADVIAFYDTRFGIGFTSQEKADLGAFLGAL